MGSARPAAGRRAARRRLSTSLPEQLPDQLHPEFAALVARFGDLLEPPARDVGLEAARRRFAGLLGHGLAGGPDVPFSDVEIDGGLTARLYRPAEAADVTVVFLHGGGWTVGDVASYDGLSRRIAAGTNAAVLAVEYRRAPEHPFPAAMDDAVAATRWALAQADRVAVAGDSGGGNLAAVVCHQLRDARATTPAVQLLLYPNVARGGGTPSMRQFGRVPFLSLSDMAWYTRNYVPSGVDIGDPRISPMEGDLSGLPPALLVTAGVDPLHDSGRDYAQATGAEWLDFPDLPHGFAHLVALAPSADEALTTVLTRFRRLLHGG